MKIDGGSVIRSTIIINNSYVCVCVHRTCNGLARLWIKVHEQGGVVAVKRRGKVQSNGECSFLAKRPQKPSTKHQIRSLLWHKNEITQVYIWYVIRILLAY